MTPSSIQLRAAGLTDEALSFPLSPAAIHWLCRFNGIDPAYCPATWRYAPNAAAQAEAEKWGSKMLEEQNDRIKWSRRPLPPPRGLRTRAHVPTGQE